MKLVRLNRPETWNPAPFEQLNTLQQEINRLFDLPFASFSRGDLFSGWSPALDLAEDKDQFLVTLELPGFRKEDLEISWHDGALNVSGERREAKTPEGAEVYRSERFFGKFHRAVTLPKSVKADQIKASYADGILTVTLPKTEEARPRQIEVQMS